MLCSGLVAEDWTSIFYLFGIVGLCWCVVWYLLATSTPETHPRITQAELRYIQSSIDAAATASRAGSAAPGGGASGGGSKDEADQGACIPASQWLAFCSSGPFAAIVVAHFVSINTSQAISPLAVMGSTSF